VITVPHVVRGETIQGGDVEHGSGEARFATPKLDLEQLVWSRLEPGPAFDVPLAEIIELLVATGAAVRDDAGGVLAEALEENARTNPLDRGVLERQYETLSAIFDGDRLRFQVERELGGADLVDGWRPVHVPDGRRCALRAFPPRLVHVMAGNSPGVAAGTIARGALTKGVHLLKLPSNDLFTVTALLRIMAALAPGHPLVQSFSAVYWRGGDEDVESVLFRPQFFDKLVAWGGESAIRSAVRYIGPGFELVAFDPKSSISLIGREAFASEDALADAASRAAVDATWLNQQACVASRFMYVEGTTDDADRFCAALLPELGVDRFAASAIGPSLPSALREDIEALRTLEPIYRLFGSFDARGIVIRSDEPVDFHPDAQVVHVVPVDSLVDAVRFANVSTQTVGVYPTDRTVEVRDGLASAGTQRVVSLGRAGTMPPGLAHDGFIPLHRFMRWVNEEGDQA